jgi:hypothetical protein
LKGEFAAEGARPVAHGVQAHAARVLGCGRESLAIVGHGQAQGVFAVVQEEGHMAGGAVFRGVSQSLLGDPVKVEVIRRIGGPGVAGFGKSDAHVGLAGGGGGEFLQRRRETEPVELHREDPAGQIAGNGDGFAGYHADPVGLGRGLRVVLAEFVCQESGGKTNRREVRAKAVVEVAADALLFVFAGG